jgi:hypothetical protein
MQFRWDGDRARLFLSFPRPAPTLESDEDWQAMNCVLDNGMRILSRSRGQKIRGIKHHQRRPKLIVADDVEDLDWVRTQENREVP